MGSNMILIQSATEKSTADVLEGLDEWGKFWLNWCRPWSVTDVNNSRIVWTRWIGVPLQAWSTSFFCLGCSKFGRLIETHETTRLKQRLDEAYILVSTGLTSIDRVLKCRIDGASFKIRIEEIRCMEEDLHLKKSEEEDSDSDSLNSEWENGNDDDSVAAFLKNSSTCSPESEETVNGGAAETTTEGERLPDMTASKVQETAANNDDSNTSQDSVGPNAAGSKKGAGDVGSATSSKPVARAAFAAEGPGPENESESGPPKEGSSQTQVSNPLLKIPPPRFLVSTTNGPNGPETNLGPSLPIDPSLEISFNSGINPLPNSQSADLSKNGVERNIQKKQSGKFTNPIGWSEFIGDMASEEDRVPKELGGKKGKGGNTEISSISGRDCWDLGKKLGLSSKDRDEVVAKALEGKENRGERLRGFAQCYK